MLEHADRNADTDRQTGVSGAHSSHAIKFVILSMPRTGSNMLTQWLSTHAEVRCLPAIFSDAGWPRRKAHGDGAMAWIEHNIKDEWDNLDRRLEKPNRLLRDLVAKSGDKAAVGFKHHMANDAFTELLLGRGSGLRKILLTRNNLLAAYSSHKVAAHTGQGSARTGQTVVRAKVKFEGEDFARFSAKRQRLYDNARKVAQGRWMEIDYTVARMQEGVASIGLFLGVDPAGFGPQKTVKRNSDDIVSRFSNPEDVWSYLRENAVEFWATES